MAQQPVPQSDLKKAGLAAALVVTLILAAGLSVVVFTRRHAPAVKPVITDAPRPEVPPDVAETGIQTEKARVQFADKKDPGRAAGMIEWAKLEPITALEKRLTEPRGYIYMRDGGIVVVSSRTGRLNTTPKSQEPQSGRFEGGVTLQLFPAGFDPKADKPTLIAKSESLDFDLPSASASTTGPFTVTSTAIDIDGSGMRLIANQVEEGIEKFEVAHVNKVTIRPDARDPLQSRGLTETQPARATPGSTRGPEHKRTYRAVIDDAVNIMQAGRTMSADRAEAWAHLVNNRLPQGAIGRFGPDPALTGSCPDTGDPANSILSLPSQLPPPEKQTPTTPAPPPAPITLAPGAKPVDSTITATWTGRMVVTPVLATGDGAQPPEFGDNQVALRLHAGHDPVKVTDDAMKGEFTAARVDVGCTTREFTLTSTPAMPVHVQTQSAGSLDCPRAVVKLGEGLIDLAGPAVLHPSATALARGPLPSAPAVPAPAKPSSLAQATTLSFAKSLVLKFTTIGNWITPDANSATIKGGFTATSGGGDVKASADEAAVRFGRRVNDHTPIEELRLSGHAVASAPAATRTVPGVQPAPAAPLPVAKPSDVTSRDTLQGDQMVFVFKPDPATGQDLPKTVEVSGDAQATAGGAGEQGLTLKARTITAELAKEKDQLVVAHATASDEVHVDTNPKPGESPMTAVGDRLDVDPTTGVAVLQGVGNGAVTVSGNGAVMIGKKVTLTQADSTVFVDGTGTLVSIKEEDPTKNPDPAKLTTSTVTWTKSMTFNNATGKATCLGDAAAIMTTGETERNTVHAETIVLTFTPAPTLPAPGTATPGAKPAAAPTRELLTAEAIGELGADGKPPHPATLERREFTVVNGEQHLDKLMYLEGQRIVADQPKRTLDVPVPGKLLVDDRTPEPVKPAAAAPAAAPNPADPISPLGGFTSAKGTSLFTWNGSLHLDMAVGGGRAVLKKDVQLTHQPFAQGGAGGAGGAGAPAPAQTTLDCDQLTAFLKTTTAPAAPSPAAPTLTGLNATLEKVQATGNVIAKSDGSQLTADTILFDTVRQFMEAAGGSGPTAADQTLVTYIDPKRPAPMRARKLTWDQKTNEIRIIDPAPTTIGQ